VRLPLLYPESGCQTVPLSCLWIPREIFVALAHPYQPPHGANVPRAHGYALTEGLRRDVVDNPWEWEEADLEQLIAVGRQEAIDLDYKASDALQKTEGKKTEISKDVSAFANSAGGTLVYGIREDKHVPVEIDGGCDPKEITKEWLEQVINSNIQRRIDGVPVKQVALTRNQPGRVAYVVYVRPEAGTQPATLDPGADRSQPAHHR
jgi:hypothetical protein